VGLKATLRRFIDLQPPGRIRGSHAANLLKQTCRWCRTLAWDREPPHHFIPFVEAVERPAALQVESGNFTGREEVRAQRGCKRYGEAKAAIAQELAAAKTRDHYVYNLPFNYLGEFRSKCCADTFMNAWGIGYTILKTVRISAVTDHAQQTKNKGALEKHRVSIKEQIKRFPRQASHYSPYDESYGKDRILSEELNYSKCWQLWCEENDNEFYKQATELQYWQSRDRKKDRPPPHVAVVIKPKCSFDTYVRAFKAYNLRFGRPRVDTCEDCDGYAATLKSSQWSAMSAAVKAGIEEAHDLHLARAKRAYKMQEEDNQRTEHDFPDGWAAAHSPDLAFCATKGQETQMQDAGGNLRTPRLTQGVAYYKRILQTFNYSVYSRAHRKHSMYFWNEAPSGT
jgi:hypothetical protein